MKAITYSSYGPPEVLTVTEVARPEPRQGEVLIRVRAAEATKADCEMRSFRYAVKWFWVPLRIALGIRKPRRQILGGYFSGEVESLGEGVTDFAPGDQVYGTTQLRLGSYGEYVALPASFAIAEKPANMSFNEAAAVPLGGLNALHFMRLAGIRPGETVLVNGAGGSIGAHAVQIAKAMGARVTAVDRGFKEAAVRGFGADDFIDYEKDPLTARGTKYDVIFDMVPTSSYSTCIRMLNQRGRYLTGNPRLSVMLRCLFTNWFTDRTASFAFAGETRAALSDLSKLIEEGKIESIVDQVYPMSRASDAHRRVETEHRLGACVIQMDG